MINIASIKKAINTTYYLQNIIYIKPILKKIPYELCKGRQPNISYFHPFRCECFILNTEDNKHYWDIFDMSKAYKVYNSITLIVEESIHVRFNDSSSDNELSELNDSFSNMNLEGLQTSSKEICLDEEPKDVKNKPTSRN
ncbi:hypothetical protein CR513_37730, partial [Mucuna pruriens]